MTKRHWISLSVLVILLIGLQACGRKFEPQEACNFVQSTNLQRVSWKAKVPVRMMVHSSVPTEAYDSIERAVTRWNEDFGSEIIRIEAWGVEGSMSPTQDGYNMIYWMNTWEENKANEQARTTIYWHGDQIFEADLRLNDKNYDFYLGTDENFTGVDLESLLVHEYGHVMGLAHNQTIGSVMNISLAAGQSRRAPDIQDVKSLRCEY